MSFSIMIPLEEPVQFTHSLQTMVSVLFHGPSLSRDTSPFYPEKAFPTGGLVLDDPWYA